MTMRMANSIMAFVNDLACISLPEAKTMATTRVLRSGLDSVIMTSRIRTHQIWHSLPPHLPPNEEPSQEFCMVSMSMASNEGYLTLTRTHFDQGGTVQESVRSYS